ncbi:ATP-binding cassette domain-containing protein [Mesomycoplasma molare]|uniref:ABC transporter ATP-binding protein/permease n=1 Tax=Mesomycoplasma molare TaxID=171288 RepID=A0ABY5TUS5_9BACT|nr:ABC transporter ATP-binding protein [Mesomycoplasma molare]UWD34408.1 ABC transporter ATP-binding protein/permease [Mesomycoplasma molare]
MFKYLKEEKKLSVLAIILEILMAIQITFSVYIPGIILELITKNNKKEFYIWITIEALLLTLSIVVALIKLFFRNKLFSKIQFHLRKDILLSIVNESVLNFEKKSKGKFISQIQDQIPLIMDRIYASFFDLFFYSSTIVISIVLAINSSLTLSLFILLFSIITTIIPLIMSSFTSKKWKELIKEYETGNIQINSFLSTYKLFYFLNIRNIFKNKLNNINTIFRKKIMKKFSILFSIEVISWYIITVTDMLLLFITGYFILFHNEPSATIIIIPALSFKISLSFRTSAWFFVHYKSLKEKILEFQNSYSYPENMLSEISKEKFETLKIENLSFKYKEGEYIFKNFNFEFKKGGKYLIKGRSGSGKSTLINILTKQLDGFEGKILLNKHNIKEISKQEINNFFTYLDSKEFVFFDTIYNNITLWEEKEEKRVKEALEKVNLSNLEINYKLNISNSLSTGQKQRINFARHFFNNKNLLILDEALANIDKENIDFIEKYLFNNKELTVINISHHAQNFEMYDEIIDMEEIKNEMSN